MIEAVDTDYFVIAEISRTGLYDGYVIKRVEDIFRVDVDCEYERKYRGLYEAKKQKHERRFKKVSANMLEDFFVWCAENKFVVSVGVNDYADTVRGIVCGVDKIAYTVCLNELTNDGVKTGKIYLDLNAVYRACADSEDEHNINELYEANNKSEMEE